MPVCKIILGKYHILNYMHILWLTTIFDDSAVSNILLQLLPYLESCKITVVSLEAIAEEEKPKTASATEDPEKKPVPYKSLATLTALNIEHISLGCKKMALFSAVQKLRRLLAILQPDIVHAQLGRSYLAALLLPTSRRKKTANKKTNKKTNNKANIAANTTTSKKPAKASINKPSKIATFHNNAEYFNRLTYRVLKLFFRRFDAISAVSQSALSSIQQHFDPLCKVPARVIYNPIFLAQNNNGATDSVQNNSQDFGNQHSQQSSSKSNNKIGSQNNNTKVKGNSEKAQGILYTLLVAGRLVEGKGHELWIAMLPYLRQLLASHHNSDLQLLCAGEGSFAVTIIQLCKTHKIADKVELLGYRHDVQVLMQNADLVLFPSQNEGFGLVPCEALLLGTPVLTHNLPVMQELLQDSAWQVDCTNSELFAQKAFDMLTKPSQYQVALARGAALIRERSNGETIANNYMQLYRDTGA